MTRGRVPPGGPEPTQPRAPPALCSTLPTVPSAPLDNPDNTTRAVACFHLRPGSLEAPQESRQAGRRVTIRAKPDDHRPPDTRSARRPVPTHPPAATEPGMPCLLWFRRARAVDRRPGAGVAEGELLDLI